jgi:hypothetical protein
MCEDIMATIEQLITRIETNVSLAAGLDVQIHAEDALVTLLRNYYNAFFDYAWWEDYLITETLTLDGTTGTVTSDLTNKIRRFKDIYAVYYSTEVRPLPKKQNNVNPSLITKRCIGPTPDPTKVFKIYPIDTPTADIHIIYRTRIADEVWELPEVSTEINMDDELLVAAVSHHYLVTEGSNPDEAETYKGMMTSRLSQLTKAELSHAMSKSSQRTSFPLDWEQFDG